MQTLFGEAEVYGMTEAVAQRETTTVPDRDGGPVDNRAKVKITPVVELEG